MLVRNVRSGEQSPMVTLRERALGIGAERVFIQVPDYPPLELAPGSKDVIGSELPTHHAANGEWVISIKTPMGPQEVDADIVVHGETFVGETRSPMGKQAISGRVVGDTLLWESQITSPMPMTLAFQAELKGDELRGNVKLGAFGNAELEGRRPRRKKA